MAVSRFHFSVDDVLDALLEPSGETFFQFLEGLHRDFQVNVDLYAFLSGKQGMLGEAAAPASSWLRENTWLRMGPHALDDATPPHAQTLQEQRGTVERTYRDIDKLVGPERRSRWVRMHYFSECFELAPEWRAHGVEALLTTDKPAVSYRLAEQERETLHRRGRVELPGIAFIRSHLRIENIRQGEDALSQLEACLPPEPAGEPCAVIFTHEYELRRPEVRAAARSLFEALRAGGAESE